MPTMPSTYRPHYAPTKLERRQTTDWARGSSRDRGYTSKWDKASKSFLARNILCPACQAAGYISLATVTDHIIPHRGDMKLFWDKNNWQACCAWHHNSVKQRLELSFEANQIKADALMLTSPYAMRLAHKLRPLSINIDG